MLLWLGIIFILLACIGLMRQRVQQAVKSRLTDEQQKTFQQIRSARLLFILYTVNIWILTLIAMKINSQLFILWIILFMLPALYLRLSKYRQMRAANLPNKFTNIELQTIIINYAILTIVIVIFAYQFPSIPSLWKQASPQMEQSSNQLEKAIEQKSDAAIQLLSHSDSTTTSSTGHHRTRHHTSTKVYSCPDLNTIMRNQNRSDSWSYGGMNWTITRHYYLPHEIVNGFVRALAYLSRGQLICDYVLPDSNRPGKNSISAQLDTPYGVVITPAGPNWSIHSNSGQCKASTNSCAFMLRPA